MEKHWQVWPTGTPEALAYMQAQRYFVESSIKELKHILGIDQFQTRKWLAWQLQWAYSA